MKKDHKEVPMTYKDHPAGTMFWLDVRKQHIIMKVDLTLHNKKGMPQANDRVWMVSLDTGEVFDVDAHVSVESIQTSHPISYFLTRAKLPRED